VWQKLDHRDPIFASKNTHPLTEVLALGKRHSPEAISVALRQLESGMAAAEIARKMGVHENTLYLWKKKYGSLGTPEVRELRELRDENRKLKQLVADLSLDRKVLQDVIQKKW
jgi:putative transposase